MTQAVGMGYELINGVYRGMQIISGTQECRFLSPLEYDTTQYPCIVGDLRMVVRRF